MKNIDLCIYILSHVYILRLSSYQLYSIHNTYIPHTYSTTRHTYTLRRTYCIHTYHYCCLTPSPPPSLTPDPGLEKLRPELLLY